MKQVQKIWAELSAKTREVELSEGQKVELASTVAQSLQRTAMMASDMRQNAGMLDNQKELAQELFGYIQKAETVKDSMQPDKAKSYEGQLAAWLDEAERALRGIESSVKELGINPSAVDGYDATQKAYPIIKKSYERLKGTAEIVEREYNRKL